MGGCTVVDNILGRAILISEFSDLGRFDQFTLPEFLGRAVFV